MSDVAWNKKESIERCVRQVRQYYALPSDQPFSDNQLVQDAIALNLQRACEQAIDLANHAIKLLKLGLPQESRQSFLLLAENGCIPRDMATRLAAMVGFRNVLVHDYQQLDLGLMVDVIEHHLDELIVFADLIVRLLQTL